jgi:hypothetical protein
LAISAIAVRNSPDRWKAIQKGSVLSSGTCLVAREKLYCPIIPVPTMIA